MNKSILIVIVIAILAALGVLGYRSRQNPQPPVTATSTGTTTYGTPTSSSTVYTNSKYRFSITLPKTWEGYTIVEDEWEGDSIDAKGNVMQGTVKGPMISVRHPDWDYKSPRQDIPVMIFTLQQWNDMQADRFHTGAAPINPSELGRNATYVFALPARYNYAYLTGYEEVEQIIQNKNFKAF